MEILCENILAIQWQQLVMWIIGAIMVAAYSYMALVPIIQPPVIKLLTTKKERMIRMPYEQKEVSKTTRILFPIVITIITGLVAPVSVALVSFLMFGNLIRECGVLNSLHPHRDGCADSDYHGTEQDILQEGVEFKPQAEAWGFLYGRLRTSIRS